MTSKELVNQVAAKAGISKTEANAILEATAEVIVQHLCDGKNVMIQNFGTLEVKQKNERLSVHPKTGVRTLTPPKMQVSLKVVNSLKDEMKNVATND